MTPEQLAALVAERDAALAEVARLSTPPDDAEVSALVADIRKHAQASVDDKAADALTRLSHALAAERKQPTRTFIVDRNGREIMLGDRVLHHNAGPNTKPEYWNGEYEVRWEAPSFVLRHVGGGLASDMGFTFKCNPGALEVITQPAPPSPNMGASEMTDLKPCPFCGEGLHECGGGIEHPQSDTCPLDSLWLQAHHRDPWNTRILASIQPAPDTMAQVREALELMRERAWGHGEVFPSEFHASVYDEATAALALLTKE